MDATIQSARTFFSRFHPFRAHRHEWRPRVRSHSHPLFMTFPFLSSHRTETGSIYISSYIKLKSTPFYRLAQAVSSCRYSQCERNEEKHRESIFRSLRPPIGRSVMSVTAHTSDAFCRSKFECCRNNSLLQSSVASCLKKGSGDMCEK